MAAVYDFNIAEQLEAEVMNLGKSMKKTLNIPLGGTIRVKRVNGAHEVFVFRGSDERGVIYEDALGNRHGDIGVYAEIALKSGSDWTVL